MIARTGIPPSDAVDRLDYLRETATLLWPGRTIDLVSAGATPGFGGDEYLILPGASRPRLVVPSRPRRVAAAGLIGHAAQAGGRERRRAAVAAVAVRTGLAGRFVPDRLRITGDGPALTDHLADVFGQPVALALPLSPPRANRKPVLRLLGDDGQALGFAKLGVDPLTTRLVRAETAALRRLADAHLPGVTLPKVVDDSEWHGRSLLVQSPLPTRNQRGAASLSDAMTAVAALDRRPAQGLADTAYWRGLRARIADLPASPALAQLAAVLSTLRDAAGDVAISTGSWHGDWTPWNCAERRDAVAVWDWERFADDVPLGFDALHHRLQSELVVSRRDPATAAARCVDDAEATLAPFDIPSSVRSITALCYLIDLAIRYTEDRQDLSGARLGRVTEWLLPTVDARVKGLRR